MAKNNIIRQ